MRAAALAVAIALAGCAGITQPDATPVNATAELKNAQGRTVGTATLAHVTNGVRVIVDARGLPPGPKGVHLHAVGKCDPPDFTSAGPHFNPDGKKHGLQSAEGPHAGDLPNITIGADGTGRLESMNERITLGSGATSLFDADGAAVVIHAAADDFRTDPTGNSGARLACGVVRKTDS
ncbi:MAG: superoxide dismutase family protein [Candidatus Rokubacteria bacterium]|nr:superoxide dismutase family protein [Candidatus Rokubacteria bacterium]